MDVLLRHTVLGEVLRLIDRNYFKYADEGDPGVLRSLVSIECARSVHECTDESTALLEDGERIYGTETILVDWYGEGDEENPLNWPRRTKYLTTAMVSVITVLLYAGSTFWSVCTDDIKERHGVGEVVFQLGTSLFVIGLGLGPMLWSPMSEMPSVGRLKVYFWSTTLYLICQIALTLCEKFWIMLVLRFLTGFLCSPVLAVGGGSVADMFGPLSRGYALSFWELATWGGSALGPVWAGYTFERFGYKGPMWELVFFGLVGLIVIICFVPETLPAAILHQRAQRLRMIHRSSKFVTYSELQEHKTSLFSIVGGLFVKAIKLNFQEPIVFVLNLYVALTFAIFFGMLESYPYVFQNPPHNFGPGQSGLTFLGIFAGGITSMVMYLLFLRYHQDHCFDKNGNICPEERLRPAIPGSVLVPFGLFWYGWTTKMHWIMPVLGGFWYGVGMFTIFMAMLSYLPDAYPSVAATVIAGNCLMRAALAASFPLFTTQFYTALGAPYATSILAVLGVLFIPWPITLFYRGRQIRERSKHARKDI